MLAFITEVHPTLLLLFMSDLDDLIRVFVVVVSRRVHILAVVVPFSMRRVVRVMILPLVPRDLAPQCRGDGRSPITLGEMVRAGG